MKCHEIGIATRLSEVQNLIVWSVFRVAFGVEEDGELHERVDVVNCVLLPEEAAGLSLINGECDTRAKRKGWQSHMNSEARSPLEGGVELFRFHLVLLGGAVFHSKGQIW